MRQTEKTLYVNVEQVNIEMSVLQCGRQVTDTVMHKQTDTNDLSRLDKMKNLQYNKK